MDDLDDFVNGVVVSIINRERDRLNFLIFHFFSCFVG